MSTSARTSPSMRYFPTRKLYEIGLQESDPSSSIWTCCQRRSSTPTHCRQAGLQWTGSCGRREPEIESHQGISIGFPVPLTVLGGEAKRREVGEQSCRLGGCAHGWDQPRLRCQEHKWHVYCMILCLSTTQTSAPSATPERLHSTSSKPDLLMNLWHALFNVLIASIDGEDNLD